MTTSHNLEKCTQPEIMHHSSRQLSSYSGSTMTYKTIKAAIKSVALCGAVALPIHTAQANQGTLNSTQPVLIYEQESNLTSDLTIQAKPITPENSTDGIIALANNTPILKSELNAQIAAVKTNLKDSQKSTLSEKKLRDDVLDGLILRKLQLEMVKRAGIQADQKTINKRLAKVAQSQGLTSLSQLQQTLDKRHKGSYEKLRQQVIEEEALKLLQQGQIVNRVRITEQDIDALLESPEASRLESTKYRTIHIRIPFIDDYNRITEKQKFQALQIASKAHELLQTTDDAKSVVKELSDGMAKDYPTRIQGGDMGYHEASYLPTDIANKITLLKVGGVTKPQVAPEGIDIIKLVDKKGGKDMIIPQWKVRHILVKTGELTSDDLAKQKIEDIYKQLLNDANFASLAATYSDDPGSAGRGGDLGWVSERQMVTDFEKMMKRTPVGDFSSPFQSQFGWHILKVEEQRKQDVSDTVKRNLAREALYQRLAPQAQEDWLQELRANAYIRIFD